MRDGLQRCAQLLVRHIDLAFARIWTLNTVTNTLELKASAGMYTHIDGAHARVPLGRFKIGRIAQERLPHLTNDVGADSWVGDEEWVRREGMVGFAGYPLILRNQVVGVVAAFSRHPFTQAIIQSFAPVAGGLAQFIQRKRVEETQNLLTAIVNGSDEAIFGKTLDGTILSWNDGAKRLYGYSAEEIIGKPLSLLLPPEQLAELSEIEERVKRGESVEHLETLRRTKDGRLIEVQSTYLRSRMLPGALQERPASPAISPGANERKRRCAARSRASSDWLSQTSSVFLPEMRRATSWMPTARSFACLVTRPRT
jgi:PAS domain S-box-containing protein